MNKFTDESSEPRLAHSEYSINVRYHHVLTWKHKTPVFTDDSSALSLAS